LYSDIEIGVFCYAFVTSDTTYCDLLKDSNMHGHLCIQNPNIILRFFFYQRKRRSRCTPVRILSRLGVGRLGNRVKGRKIVERKEGIREQPKNEIFGTF
jgi:hypothetical protein